MAYRVSVDKDVCISSGKCVADAPSAFTFDDDEVAQPTPGATALPASKLLDIARNCPSGAIQLVDDGGALVDVG